MRPVASVFLKAPRWGTVKTRLGATVGHEAALRLYRRMAEASMATVRSVGWSGIVWYTPVDAGPEMAGWLGGEWVYRPQCEGDLGDRLAHAATFANPSDSLVFLGGDCPELAGEHLRAAETALAAGRVVIGPSLDGGYYLLGGPGPLPDLFSGMPWSTPRLLEATRSRLRALGVLWHELPILRDVDTASDAMALGLLT